MKVMLAKTLFWMGLLLVLLGEGSSGLMASGPGIPPGTGPRGAISVVS